MATGFISFQIKNGNKYARFCVAKYKDGRKYNEETSLGRVIDEEKGIFKNRERGLFTFSVDNGYGPAPKEIAGESAKIASGKMKTVLDFGDSFFLHTFLQTTPYWDVFQSVTDEKDRDTFLALVWYSILNGGAGCHAKTWWEGNYAAVLFPSAALESARISEFLSRLGQESNLRKFFSRYLHAVLSGPGIHGILVDSEGLPDSINMEIAQLSNYAGDINAETRLMYVCERNTGFPLYFRYISGNSMNFSMAATTVEEMERADICTDFAILDAGYCSDNDITMLYEKNIAFVTRLKRKRALYKSLVEKCLPALEEPENLVAFDKRYLYMKKVQCELCGNDAFAYVCKDPTMGTLELRNKIPRVLADGASNEEAMALIRKAGVFVIISSKDLEPDEILPLYYTRRQIEQVFGITKNHAEILSLRVHGEDAFRGHLFIAFVAAIVCHLLQKLLKEHGIDRMEALQELRNQKCKIYDHVVIPLEPKKRMNDMYRICSCKVPARIPVAN